MTGRRQLPPVEELVKMREDGMSLRDIADRVQELTGERITKSGISAALVRAGAGKDQVRYQDLIPWQVLMGHQKQYHVRMLRVEGRLRAGGHVEEGALRRLENWKAELEQKRAVIHYNPMKEPGFHAVPRREGIDTDLIRWTPEQLVDMLGMTPEQVRASGQLGVRDREWGASRC